MDRRLLRHSRRLALQPCSKPLKLNFARAQRAGKSRLRTNCGKRWVKTRRCDWSCCRWSDVRGYFRGGLRFAAPILRVQASRIFASGVMMPCFKWGGTKFNSEGSDSIHFENRVSLRDAHRLSLFFAESAINQQPDHGTESGDQNPAEVK